MKLIDDDREAETTINNLSKKSPNEIHAGGFLSPSDALAYTGVDDKKIWWKMTRFFLRRKASLRSGLDSSRFCDIPESESRPIAQHKAKFIRSRVN